MHIFVTAVLASIVSLSAVAPAFAKDSTLICESSVGVLNEAQERKGPRFFLELSTDKKSQSMSDSTFAAAIHARMISEKLAEIQYEIRISGVHGKFSGQSLVNRETSSVVHVQELPLDPIQDEFVESLRISCKLN